MTFWFMIHSLRTTYLCIGNILFSATDLQQRLWNVQRHLPSKPRGQMYAKVLEQRARYKVEPFLSQAQMGSEKEGAAQTQFSP